MRRVTVAARSAPGDSIPALSADPARNGVVALFAGLARQRERRAACHPREPVRPYAQNELERRYERVRKRGRELPISTSAGRHKLRIAIKKLRYAVEFFTSLFDGEEADALRAHLARLQDILGTMNDAATLQRLLGEVHAGTSELAMAEARGSF